jgi:NAD(P)-dependent dehydrogenase (short-subunit alcohol dehydrogenase family)
MEQLKDKTAIVTGAAQGIGLAIAKRFYGEGANLVICDINDEKLLDAVESISEDKRAIETLEADITLDSDINKVKQTAVERFGKIDILVNNAGIARLGRLEEAPTEDWEVVMRTNAYAPWRLMVAVLPEMRKSGGGAIINLSSINGIKAFPGDGIYCASKAALQMLSQVMAMEAAADNIRVNVILPGFVEGTGLPVPRGGYENMRKVHPLGRNAQPKDIADAALFLASEQSRHITGVMLNVDGGRHMATN